VAIGMFHAGYVAAANFGYLMHPVGYLHEDYHDARSLEH
jgi:hypothetical protein